MSCTFLTFSQRVNCLCRCFICSGYGPHCESLRARYQRSVMCAHLQGLILPHLYHCTFLRCKGGNNSQPTRAPVINGGLAWVSVTRFHLLLWGRDEGADWGQQMDSCALSELAQCNLQQGQGVNNTWSTWHWLPASSLLWESKYKP